MKPQQIIEHLNRILELPESCLSLTDSHIRLHDTLHWVRICEELRRNEVFFVDFLVCLTAIDAGDSWQVVYQLRSIVYEYEFSVLVQMEKNPDRLPSLPSVAAIWQTANWHEREAYDLMGIVFENHPDMRRILLPADWVGYPLRKDYQTDATYHGIQIDF
jgi:NADH-quinone oxidoreductase subunit C